MGIGAGQIKDECLDRPNEKASGWATKNQLCTTGSSCRPIDIVRQDAKGRWEAARESENEFENVVFLKLVHFSYGKQAQNSATADPMESYLQLLGPAY